MRIDYNKNRRVICLLVLCVSLACAVFRPSVSGGGGSLFSDSFPLAKPQARDAMTFEQVLSVFEFKLLQPDLPKARMLAKTVLTLSNEFGFAPSFILAVIQVESNFRIRARSSQDAFGLMQVQWPTAQYMARKLGIRLKSENDLYEPKRNLRIGVAYLAELRGKYDSNPFLFLAAYNAGPARVDRLLLEGRLRPVQTRDYYLKIRRETSLMVSYGRDVLGEEHWLDPHLWLESILPIKLPDQYSPHVFERRGNSEV